MTAGNEVLLLLDMDNTTLLDNDRFATDPGATLQQAFGAQERDCFFAVKWVVAMNERDPSTAARAGSVRQETL